MSNKRYVTYMILLGILLLIVLTLSLTSGSYAMQMQDVIETFLGHGDRMQEFTIYQLRLPRILLAMIVALALSTSGVILQTITRNPLVEPGMVGINAGAALFAVIFIALQTSAYYTELSLSAKMVMPIVAMIGSFFGLFIVVALAYKRTLPPTRFLLCGVGVNIGIHALLTFFQLSMSKGDFNQVLTWTNGSLWGSSWEYILFSFLFILPFFLLVYLRAPILDIWSLGEESAQGLGINTKKEMILFLILSTVFAGIATAVAGNIAFLALLGPQIAKRMVGNHHRRLFLLSAEISMVILLLSDLLARTLFAPIEIPVGIIVSLVGVPYFLYLMLNRK